MTEITGFPSSTARHALPFLIAGQAQKEFFVNEAFARLDMLLHPVVESAVPMPPADPVVGQCHIVASPASSGWEGYEDSLAGWDGTQWTFASPSDSMAVFDRSEGKVKHFRNGWQLGRQPVAPTGGDVTDIEARAAIADIIEVLRSAGLVSDTN